MKHDTRIISPPSYSRILIFCKCKALIEIYIDTALFISTRFILRISTIESSDFATKQLTGLISAMHPQYWISKIPYLALLLVLVVACLLQLLILSIASGKLRNWLSGLLTPTLQAKVPQNDRVLLFAYLGMEVGFKIALVTLLGFNQCASEEKIVETNKNVFVTVVEQKNTAESTLVQYLYMYPQIGCYGNLHLSISGVNLFLLLLSAINMNLLEKIARVSFFKILASRKGDAYLNTKYSTLILGSLALNYGDILFNFLVDNPIITLSVGTILFGSNYALSYPLITNFNIEHDRVEKHRIFSIFTIFTLLLTTVIVQSYWISYSSHFPRFGVMIGLFLLVILLVRIHFILLNTSTNSWVYLQKFTNQRKESTKTIMILFFRWSVYLFKMAELTNGEASYDLMEGEVDFWYIFLSAHQEIIRNQSSLFIESEIQEITAEPYSNIDIEQFHKIIRIFDSIFKQKIAENPENEDLIICYLNFSIELKGDLFFSQALIRKNNLNPMNFPRRNNRALFLDRIQQKIDYYISNGGLERPYHKGSIHMKTTHHTSYETIFELQTVLANVPKTLAKLHKNHRRIFQELLDCGKYKLIVSRAAKLDSMRNSLESKLLKAENCCIGSFTPLLSLICYFYKYVFYSNLKLRKWTKELLQNQRNTLFRYVLELNPIDNMIVLLIGNQKEDFHKIKMASGETEEIIGFNVEELIGEDLSLILPNYLKQTHKNSMNISSIYDSFLERDKGVTGFAQNRDGWLTLITIRARILFSKSSGIILMGVINRSHNESIYSEGIQLVITKEGFIIDLTTQASKLFEISKSLSHYSPRLSKIIKYLGNAAEELKSNIDMDDIFKNIERRASWEIFLVAKAGISMEVELQQNHFSKFRVAFQDIYLAGGCLFWVVSFKQLEEYSISITNIDSAFKNHFNRNEKLRVIENRLDGVLYYGQEREVRHICGFEEYTHDLIIHTKPNIEVCTQSNECKERLKLNSFSNSGYDREIRVDSNQIQKGGMKTFKSMTSILSNGSTGSSQVEYVESICLRIDHSMYSRSSLYLMFLAICLFISTLLISEYAINRSIKSINEIRMQSSTLDICSFSITAHQMLSLFADMLRAEREGWIDENYYGKYFIYPSPKEFYFEFMFSIADAQLYSELQLSKRISDLTFPELYPIEWWTLGRVIIETPKIDYSLNKVVGWSKETFSRRAATEYVEMKTLQFFARKDSNYSLAPLLGLNRDRDNDELEEFIRRNLQGSINEFYYNNVFYFYEYMKKMARLPIESITLQYLVLLGLSTIYLFIVWCFSILESRRLIHIYDELFLMKREDALEIIEVLKAKELDAKNIHQNTINPDIIKRQSQSNIGRRTKVNQELENSKKEKKTNGNQLFHNIRLTGGIPSSNYTTLALYLVALMVLMSLLNFLLMQQFKGSLNKLGNVLCVQILVIESWGSFMNAQNSILKSILWNDTSLIWGQPSSIAFEVYSEYISKNILANFSESIDWNLGNFTDEYRGIMTNNIACGSILLVGEMEYLCKTAYNGALNSPLLTVFRHIHSTQRELMDKWRISRYSWNLTLELLYDEQFRSDFSIHDQIGLDWYFIFGQKIGAALFSELDNSSEAIARYALFIRPAFCIWVAIIIILLSTALRDYWKIALHALRLFPQYKIAARKNLLKHIEAIK